MLPAGTLISRKIAVEFGNNVSMLQGIITGSIASAGGLPRTCSLPWHDGFTRGIQAVMISEMPSVNERQSPLQQPGLMSPEVELSSGSDVFVRLESIPAPASADFQPCGSTHTCCAPAVNLGHAAQLSSTAATDEAGELESIIQDSLKQAASTGASAVEASSRPTRAASASSTESGATIHRLEDEIRALKKQRRQLALKSIAAGVQAQQQAVLRAWCAQAAQVKGDRDHKLDVSMTVADATEALRTQFRQRRVSHGIHRMRQLRRMSFHSWRCAVELGRLEGQLCSATAASSNDVPVSATIGLSTSEGSSSSSSSSKAKPAIVTASSNPCDCGKATSWGCEEHRVYAPGLLLAHWKATTGSAAAASSGRSGARLRQKKATPPPGVFHAPDSSSTSSCAAACAAEPPAAAAAGNVEGVVVVVEQQRKAASPPGGFRTAASSAACAADEEERQQAKQPPGVFYSRAASSSDAVAAAAAAATAATSARAPPPAAPFQVEASEAPCATEAAATAEQGQPPRRKSISVAELAKRFAKQKAMKDDFHVRPQGAWAVKVLQGA
eukprot:TRINITY_DN12366_c0_g3_i2.p1 TRINITY_DN12366_c0_g3~~TRINITY_DN12366_c0_g3_i2.p1  ORF type:complete len:556 (+),score=137.67 TRINITY_DN12366_c0_g3_i2:73-1740(+)